MQLDFQVLEQVFAAIGQERQVLVMASMDMVWERWECAAERGPVILIINYKNKTYHITIAPRWYLYKNNIEFRNGMELEITGSKFLSKEGTFYISARKIKFTENEKTIELRDSHCKPMWRRMH